MKRDLLPEETIVFENPDYDDALIGLSTDGRAVYALEKMVECLVREDGMTEMEALEFIGFNTVRALGYIEGGPIIVEALE